MYDNFFQYIYIKIPEVHLIAIVQTRILIFKVHS